MRFAAIDNEENVQRIAGWLADEGKVVRRFADAEAFSAFDPNEAFAWVICAVADAERCQAISRTRAGAATRCLIIAGPDNENVSPAWGNVLLTTPLRRRIVLQLLNSEN